MKENWSVIDVNLNVSDFVYSHLIFSDFILLLFIRDVPWIMLS